MGLIKMDLVMNAKLLTDVLTPQGILAVVEKNKSNDLDFKQDLFLILDNIQDPRKHGNYYKNSR